MHECVSACECVLACVYKNALACMWECVCISIIVCVCVCLFLHVCVCKCECEMKTKYGEHLNLHTEKEMEN